MDRLQRDDALGAIEGRLERQQHRLGRDRRGWWQRRRHRVAVGGTEAGQGLVPTIFGFVVVLVIALFATQVVFDLYARSAVTSAAVEAARSVAGFASSAAYVNGSSAAEERAVSVAEDRARSTLGRWGSVTSFTWTFLPADGPPDIVELAVHFDATASGFNLARPGALPMLNRFARTVRVRVEHVTCPTGVACHVVSPTR